MLGPGHGGMLEIITLYDSFFLPLPLHYLGYAKYYWPTVPSASYPLLIRAYVPSASTSASDWLYLICVDSFVS
eukprot:4157698-Pleurochrysis_carterae.AAC.1